MASDAFEIHGASRPGLTLITCEHASNAVPAPLAASAADLPWLRTHWGYDIGAAAVARRLAARSDCAAVLATVSRLVCDLNRDVDAPTWIRAELEGHALSFNAGLDEAERERRRVAYHEPYHAAVDRMLGSRTGGGGDVLLLSVHSFTPVYGDDDRSMEIGILFDRYAPVARRFQTLLQGQGFAAVLNAPYSGMDGMMFAAQRHGTTHNVVYLEIEIRQDLIAEEAAAVAVADRIGEALDRLRLRTMPRG